MYMWTSRQQHVTQQKKKKKKTQVVSTDLGYLRKHIKMSMYMETSLTSMGMYGVETKGDTSDNY